MRYAWRNAGRVALHAIEERRAHENARHAGAYAFVERAALRPRSVVERQCRLEVLRGDGTSKRTLRERGEDPCGTWSRVSRPLGLAHEQAIAARCLADAGRVVRPLDADGLQLRETADEMNLLAVAPRRLPHILQSGGAIAEREAEVVGPGRNFDLRRHARVDNGARFVHVLDLDLVILEAADLRGVHLVAIERDHKGVGKLVPFDAGVAFLDAANEPAKNLVLAVSREHVAHQPSATRAEGQTLDVGVLAEIAIDAVLGSSGIGFHIA